MAQLIEAHAAMPEVVSSNSPLVLLTPEFASFLPYDLPTQNQPFLDFFLWFSWWNTSHLADFFLRPPLRKTSRFLHTISLTENQSFCRFLPTISFTAVQLSVGVRYRIVKETWQLIKISCRIIVQEFVGLIHREWEVGYRLKSASREDCSSPHY